MMNKAFAFALIVALAIVAAITVHSCEAVEPAELRGPARVLDGDTLKVGPVTVRLAEIDAPEKKQPFGPEATAYLQSLIGDRDVVCHVTSTDLYGRCVAHVKSAGGGRWFNDQIVEAGMAHWYEAFSKDQAIADAEKLAKSERRGLWRASRIEKPWVYRARIKKAK
jgi:micrococcal nuclease